MVSTRTDIYPLKMSEARSKPRCITLPGMFVNRRPAGKKGAAQTAAEGQGGKEKKDPPEVSISVARQLSQWLIKESLHG